MTRAGLKLLCVSSLSLLLLSPLAYGQGAADSATSSAAPATSAAPADASAAAPAAAAGPDLKKGGAIAAAVCAACHGIDGNASGPTFPKLASQHPEYLVKQLMNFKLIAPATVAERPNAIMSPIAAALSNADMTNVAAYYAGQTLKRAVDKDPTSRELGQKIWRGGVAERGVPACAACHGPTGSGLPIQYPRLGGQWSEYLQSQLVDFQNGSRHNSVPMSTIASRLSDADMKAVSEYAAGLH